MDQMLDKQDEMLKLERETVTEIRELRDDVALHSNADRQARMEKDISAIKAKIGIV